jgi:hypothetical protein
MSKAILTALLLLSGMLQQIPPAFPREGAIQIIDNNRVAVWDVTWPKGKPTLMLQGKLDMVTIELEDAAIKVTSAKSKTNARNRTHSEELIKGASRAIIVELNDQKPRSKRTFPIETVEH